MIETKERRQVTGKGYVSVPSLASVPISKIDRKHHHLAIKYKALAFHEDRKNSSLASVSSFVIEQKRVPPVFNQSLGVWQCAEGTRYGGRFTDKFGRGCGGGILRRLGSALGRLGDVEAFNRIERAGEQRDLRRLARFSARQSYRDELSKIRETYPSLGRRALRRIGGTFRRVDNALTAGPLRLPKRSQRGAKPTTPSIVSRFAQRGGDAFNRLIDRALYGRRQGQRGKRTRITPRAARRQQRGQTPRQPGAISRFADRAGSAYARLIDRVLYGPQKRGRRGRRGLAPGQAGQTIVIPKKPKTARAKKKKAVVQKTKPKPAVPVKKVKKSGLIDLASLDLVGKKKLKDKALEQFDYLDEFWRKRLGIPDGQPITDEAIDKYIQDRIDAKKPGAYIGMLKANRNDYQALRAFKEKLDAKDPDAYAELNNVGPTRRNALIEALGVTTPTKPKSKPKPKQKPKPKPADVEPAKPAGTPEPETTEEPEAQPVDAVIETAEPEAEPEQAPDLPDFLQPEDSPEAFEEPTEESLEPDSAEETPVEIVEPETIEEPEEPPVTDFLQPEPDAEEAQALVEETPIAPIEVMTPPVPEIPQVNNSELDDPDLPTDITTENIAVAQAQQAFAATIEEYFEQIGKSSIGALGNKEYDVSAEGLEDAIADAKAISKSLADLGYGDEPVAIVRIVTDSGEEKYIITLPSLVDKSKISKAHTDLGNPVPTFKNEKSLGTLQWWGFEKLIDEAKPVTSKTWSSAGIVEKSITTKGVENKDALALVIDLHSRAKALEKDTILVSALSNKKMLLIGGTAEEVLARIKELKLDNPDTIFGIVAGVNATTGDISLTDDAWKYNLSLKDADNNPFQIYNSSNWASTDGNLEKVLNALSKAVNELPNDSSYEQSFSTHSLSTWFAPWSGSRTFKGIETIKKYSAAASDSDWQKFKIIRRSPSTGNVLVSFAHKTPYVGSGAATGPDLGTQFWKATDIPTQSGPNSVYGLVAGAKSTYAPDANNFSAHLVRVKTSTGTKWIIVDQDRLDFMTTQGLINKNDVLFSSVTTWSSHRIKWNSNFSVDGSDTTGNQSWQTYELEDLPLLSAAVNAKLPELNLPVEKIDDAVIEIDETYAPGFISVPMIDGELAEGIIKDFLENTAAGQKFLIASKYAAKNELIKQKTYGKLTPDILANELESAKKALESALKAIPSESSSYGAIANMSKVSHNKAARAYAKVKAIEELIDQKKAEGDIAQVSKTIAKALGVPEFSPDSSSFDGTETPVQPLTPDEALAVALSTPLEKLPNDPIFKIANVDAWLPSLLAEGTSNGSAWATIQSTMQTLEQDLKNIPLLKPDGTPLTVDEWVKEAQEKTKERLSLALDFALAQINIDISVMADDGEPMPSFFKLNKTNELLQSLKDAINSADGWPGGTFDDDLDNLPLAIVAAIEEDFKSVIASGGITDKSKWQLGAKEKLKIIMRNAIATQAVSRREKYLKLSAAFVEGLVKSVKTEPPAPPKLIVTPSDPLDFDFSSELNIPDTFGLLGEMSMEANVPMLVWLQFSQATGKRSWVAGTYEQFMSDVNNADITVSSVLGGVTPNGSIYVASTSISNQNPTAKWISKFGKYGTGGFKPPTGAKYVIEDEDFFANLDTLTESLKDQRIVGITSQWTLTDAKGAVAATTAAPDEAKGLDNYISQIVGEDGVDSVMDEPLTYAAAQQLLNVYGLYQLIQDVKDDTGKIDPNFISPQKTVFIVAGQGDIAPYFYIVSVSDDSESERAAVKEFLRDKLLIATMIKTSDLWGEVDLKTYDTARPFTEADGKESKMLKAFDDSNFYLKFSNAISANTQMDINDLENLTLLGNPSWPHGGVQRDLDSAIAQAKALLANASAHKPFVHETINSWFEGDVDLPDVESVDLIINMFDLTHGSTGIDAKGYATPTDADAKSPYQEVTSNLKGMHLLTPWLSALFTFLDDKNILSDMSAIKYNSPEYEVIAGKIGENAGTPLGTILQKLDALVANNEDLQNNGATLTREQFNAILASAIGGDHSPNTTLQYLSALRQQIQALAVGNQKATSKLDAILNDSTSPSEYAADAVDINGISIHDLPVDDVIALIDKTQKASDAEVFQLLKKAGVSSLHPIAYNAALIGRRSQQLTFIRAIASTILVRQEKDPEGAALLRSALRHHLETDLLLSSTPAVYKNKIINWLNSGGYPDLKPASTIYDETTGIPATSIGKFNPSLLGSVSPDGKAVAHHVPPHPAIPDIETAVAHLSSGGKLSEVPDIFLRSAIVANMGEGMRFLPDPSISGGYNKDVFGFFDTASPGVEPDSYMRYVVKFADRNANEHINEIMGSQLEHRIGLFAVGHRVASPVKKKVDKNGNLEPQRAIVQEHIANLFDGSGWTVLGHWGSVSSDDVLDPESLARFVAVNRFMNHYDRTPANVIAVRAPDGKVHIVPIDDGNGFYGFNAKKVGQKADTDAEQLAGFIASIGVGLDWFGKTEKMSDDDKLTFAIALKEATDTFLSTDLDKMMQEIIAAHPWTDDELAHIASRFETLKERQKNRDWASMLQEVYKKLNISESDVDAGLQAKKKAVYSGISSSSEQNSPQGAFQSLTKLPRRNISAGYLWDGPSIDRQQVLVGSATLIAAPFDEDEGKLAMYSTMQLSGDARTVANNLADGVNGWKILKSASGSKVDKPVSASYRQLIGKTATGPYTNKRSLVLDKASTEFGLSGTNYYKKLDDGTVVIVYVTDNKSDVFSGYTTFYKVTDDPENQILSIPDADQIMENVLQEFGGTSEPPSQEILALTAFRQLAFSLQGGSPNQYDNMSEQEIAALLSSWNISISDLELAFDADGSPYMRLTKEARRQIANTVQKSTLIHRYIHHDDGQEKAFVNTALTGRLASARRRIPHGIPGAGWSTYADSGYQSNDYVFFKFGPGQYSDPKDSLLDVDLSDEGIIDALKVNSAFGNILSYFPVEFAIEKPDTRWTTRDVFGNINAHVSITESASSTTAPEPLIRDSMSMARGIHIIPASMYESVMSRIKVNGVTEISGIPVEVLIVPSDADIPAAWKALRQYWIDLGWI